MHLYRHFISVSLFRVILANTQSCPRSAELTRLATCLGPPIPYIVQPSAGKGLGMFASHDLEAGDIIMRETPPLKIIPPEFIKNSGYPMTEVTKLVRKEFEKLSEQDQDEIMSLTYHGTAAEIATVDKLGIIFRTNAYNSGTEIGLFPKIARINHSCRPNASYYWSDKLNKRIVFVYRKIKEGEEIFVSYIPLLMSQEERQKRLDRYGFKCTCDACSQEREAKAASDERRTTIQKAFVDFERQLTLTPPKTHKGRQQARKNAKASLQLIELLHQEGLTDYYAKAYRTAAFSHARVLDWEPAAIWANKGYELKYMEDPDSWYTQEMHNLTSNFIANWENELGRKTHDEMR